MHRTLSEKSRPAIADDKNLVLCHPIRLGNTVQEFMNKLKIPANFKSVLAVQPFESLDITHEHAHAIKDLPRIP